MSQILIILVVIMPMAAQRDTLGHKSHLNNLVEQALVSHIEYFAPIYQSRSDTIITSFNVIVDRQSGEFDLPIRISGYQMIYTSDDEIMSESHDWMILIRIHPIRINTENDTFGLGIMNYSAKTNKENKTIDQYILGGSSFRIYYDKCIDNYNIDIIYQTDL